MPLENFIVGIVIFARQAIFSALYIGKSLGKQDLYDLWGYCMARHVEIFWNLKNVSWISPGNRLGWICRHPVPVHGFLGPSESTSQTAS